MAWADTAKDEAERGGHSCAVSDLLESRVGFLWARRLDIPGRLWAVSDAVEAFYDPLLTFDPAKDEAERGGQWRTPCLYYATAGCLVLAAVVVLVLLYTVVGFGGSPPPAASFTNASPPPDDLAPIVVGASVNQ